MRLWDGMLTRLVVRSPIDRPNLPLPCDAAFQLGLDFLATALLERVGASATDDDSGDEK
jgi:hypothetical protein